MEVVRPPLEVRGCAGSCQPLYTVQHAALLASQRLALGRPANLRDTLIAGIALVRGAQVATATPDAFRGARISLIDPFAF